ncbi:hypothetical protein GUJ93_ZPchr0369g33554 [Zizania palustris]|uniref:Delta(24)-sterol reductase n=1 Tax=Zizania palustris TaxID=103762 RepID=A0A8J6BZA6_ZIZPA|nr:hypothetical protein GUJ93_ZPchr0369g33554 [Zizania palustris]
MVDLQEPLVRPKKKKDLVDYLVKFRWIVVIFVVLPISVLIYFNIYLGDMWSALKSEKRRQKQHDESVQKVVKRLKQRNPKKDGLVCTARKPWIAVGMRNVDYKRARHFEVDLSAFRNILEVDKERMVAKVEPLVNMGQITRYTCSMNLALAVVAELDDLTVGGLINGYGIEGSSHLYGLFSDTVVAMEVVLADGRVGTLGFLVSAEIKLIPIKEYMRLTYTPVKGTLKEMAQAYADSFAPRDGEEEGQQDQQCRVVVQALVLPACSDSTQEGFLFGWLMPPKVSLLKATQGESIRNYYHDNHVIQDMLVPLYKVGDALEFVHKEMEVYPLWLCPHRLYKLPVKTMVYPEPGFEHHHRQGDTSYAQMFTDVGVYYAPAAVLRGEVFDGAQAVHRLEQWLIENHSYQPQYAVSELNEKDFWRMFDASHYEHCRQKYGAVGTFMSVYYKSKKGRKTEKEVQEAEAAILEPAYADEA